MIDTDSQSTTIALFLLHEVGKKLRNVGKPLSS